MEEAQWRWLIDCPSCSATALQTSEGLGRSKIRCASCGFAQRITEYEMSDKEKKWVGVLIKAQD